MADSIELLVSVDQAQQFIAERRSALVDILAERIDMVNQIMADRVKENLDGGVLQRRTGNLYNSVMQEPAQISGDQMTAAVTAGGDGAPYGIYFEEGGSSYYEIRPVNARVLAFMGEGRMLFAQVVNHPPTPKLPWFQPEVDTASPEMESQLNEAISEAFTP